MNKEEKANKKIVGLDIGKKSIYALRYNENGAHERRSFFTDPAGLNYLEEWLTKNDIIGLEAGNQSFRIAKSLLKQGYDVIVLNPGKLAMIYKSLKKTDAEDALKIARLIKGYSRYELPEVCVPSDEMEDARRLCTEQGLWKKQRTILVNRFHALFVQAGFTNITKKDIKDPYTRNYYIEKLPERYFNEARRLNICIIEIDKIYNEIEEEIRETLRKDLSFTMLAMSMPGIGPINALVLYAYVNDCSRFSSGKQIAYYAGLVPRIDISGDTNRYGRITKQGPKNIRRVLIQGAWSLVRSNKDTALKDFYNHLYSNRGKGKGKSIVALARKMLCVFYAMIKKGELFKGVEHKDVIKKLRSYGIISKEDTKMDGKT